MTFDDGYKDHYTYVLPVLLENNIQGSFYIPTKCFQDKKVLDVNKIHFILESCIGEEGKILKEMNLVFDVAYTSYLKRAIKTLNIVLEEMDELYIPVYKSWRLNERHYGALQGLNKAETAKKYGDEQVHIWRRSFDIAPPSIDKNSEYYPKSDRRYADLADSDIPLGESLKDTIARVLPYWHSDISKSLQEGKNVIVAAHGNSLRALIKYLLNISNEDILNLNLVTGKPMVFEIDKDLKVLSAPELF